MPAAIGLTEAEAIRSLVALESAEGELQGTDRLTILLALEETLSLLVDRLVPERGE